MEIATLGLPIGATVCFEAMLFNSGVFLAGRIGVADVAAYQVALNVAAMAFMMPFGISHGGRDPSRGYTLGLPIEAPCGARAC